MLLMSLLVDTQFLLFVCRSCLILFIRLSYYFNSSEYLTVDLNVEVMLTVSSQWHVTMTAV